MGASIVMQFVQFGSLRDDWKWLPISQSVRILVPNPKGLRYPEILHNMTVRETVKILVRVQLVECSDFLEVVRLQNEEIFHPISFRIISLAFYCSPRSCEPTCRSEKEVLSARSPRR